MFLLGDCLPVISIERFSTPLTSPETVGFVLCASPGFRSVLKHVETPLND